MEMDIVSSAVAGLIAALTATIILGIAKWVRQWWVRRQDVSYLRDVLSEGRKRVMEAKDTFHEGMNATSSADVLRAAQYNNMIKKIAVGVERWTPNLSHAQRQNLLAALAWHHKHSYMKKNTNYEAVFPELPDGIWPAREMHLERATEIFNELQSIRWLKLPPLD